MLTSMKNIALLRYGYCLQKNNALVCYFCEYQEIKSNENNALICYFGEYSERKSNDKKWFCKYIN
jgi:hypothetical protein